MYVPGYRFVQHASLNHNCDTKVVFDVFLSVCCRIFMWSKSAISIDLIVKLETRTVLLSGWKQARLVNMVLLVDLMCASHFVGQESPPT